MKKLIEFYKPQETIPISITGQYCALDCAHCGGHFLKAMVPINMAFEEIRKRKSKSCLISGGCNANGKVPCISSAQKEIAGFRNNHKINMHVGMIEDTEIDEVCGLADVISLDIPVSTRVVRDVYGLQYEYKDYISLYNKLRRKTAVVPHICLGLTDSPELKDEIALLEELAIIKPEKLCYIIFTPVAGTKFESKKPPKISAVSEFFKKTRTVLPDTQFYLGCMRPGGIYRDEIDVKAVEAGAQGIVMPSRKAVKGAQELGMEIIWKYECCSF